ncbi:MAG: TIGR03915 family putative DNA repair protein [Oscillospiraceae bacterium]|jgi:probable DNA metabolism protein|nr:TIGR03915 family putative DNA repair protein [Oscillospiraceae bacterium]
MTNLYYTPTWEGFLTAVFEAFDRGRRGETVSIRHPRESAETSMFDAAPCHPDPDKAGRVERGMARLAPGLPETVYMAWLSERPGVEDDLLGLLALGFERKRDPRGDMTHPLVMSVSKAARQTGQERQRMLQFVRFVQTPEGIYVADIEPNSNVLPLIAEHFHGRFNDQRLLIRDLRRRLVLVSRQNGWFIRELGPDEEIPPLPEDGLFEDLWRGYFRAVSNPARKNLRLQQHFVPLRYREHLTEFQAGAARF